MIHPLRLTWSVGAGVLVVSAVLLAQETSPPSSQSPPEQSVFRAGVELVEVTVSVSDEKGRAVTDLTIDDFEVREAGVRQAVALFERVGVPLPPPAPKDQPLMPSVAADVAANDFPDNGRAFAIILDDLQLLGWKTPALRRTARQFVERVGPDDLLLVIGTSGRADPTQDFTTDKARVLRSIDSVVGTRGEEPPGMRPMPCEGSYQSASLLETMRALATHLAEVRRRRLTVIFISEGVSLGGFTGPDLATVGEASGCPEVAQRAIRAVEALQQSNITLYAVDPYLETGTPADSLRVLAESTGGYATTNFFSSIGDDFDRIMQESSHYYVLGYYPIARRTAGQFRAIDVRVRRPDLRVSHRTGYVYRSPAPASRPVGPGPRRTTPAPLASVLDYALPTTGLVMRVQAIPLRNSNTSARVQVIVEISGKDLQFDLRDGRFVERLELATVTFDSRARRSPERTSAVNLRLTAAERDRVSRTGIRWTTMLDLPSGRHDLRVAGHAVNTGLRGSVFLDVDVPRFGTDTTASGLAITSLAAGATYTTGGPILLPPLPVPPTVQRVFTSGDVLAVSAEIYAPAQRTLLLRRRTGEIPTEFVVRISQAAPPQLVVIDQPLPVLNDRHKVPYVSFAINTKRLGVGRFVLQLVRRADLRPPNDTPGAVLFQVVDR